jgi:indoleamine 2,3-dioxygenase
LVPLAIEIKGAPALSAILEAQKAILLNDSQAVNDNLNIISGCIVEMTATLKRMYEKCDPSVFWKRVRHYSGGSKNSRIFPDGVFYEGVVEVFGSLS